MITTPYLIEEVTLPPEIEELMEVIAMSLWEEITAQNLLDRMIANFRP